MFDQKQIWEKCLLDVETSVSKANFSTWFKNTHISKYEDGIVCVGVPNEFVKDWLANKYHKLILKTLMTHAEEIRSVDFVISKNDHRNKDEIMEIKKNLINRELPLHDLYINKEDNLNPRYLFDSFIVGPFNELAYAAAQAIVNRPGTNYNPFFVYGASGLGKTHLIQAIGNAIKLKFPEKKVYYTTLERFSNDYVNSVLTNKSQQFKDKYRKYDVLIIDDIQFISTKEGTKDEFFHLFNSFYEQNKQLIFSSDKHPNYISGLEDRVKSRFLAGMSADITEPDLESRIAIIKQKMKDQDCPFPQEIVDYLASSLEGSIRELEGSLNAIICQTKLKNRDLSLNEVKNLVRNSIKPKKNFSIKDIVKCVADYYTIDEASVYEKTRRKEIVKARQMVMYILREDFSVSYPLIGQKLGGKDHTTVIHSFMKIKEDLKINPTLNHELEQIRTLFK